MNLDGVAIQDHLFEEWTDASAYSIIGVRGPYDGVLGLAPPWNKDSATPNILSSLVTQNRLPSQVFSLKLPVYSNETGELSLGSSNPEFYHPGSRPVPVIPIPDTAYDRNKWTVPTSHISLNTSIPLNLTLEGNGTYAFLDSGDPYIILPDAYARDVLAAIGAQRGPSIIVHHVPCWRRQELPRLTFTLNGQDFSISAFEYTVEADFGREVGIVCMTTIYSQGDFALRSSDGIVLGSPFLRGFYSIFDFGEREVTCKLTCSRYLRMIC